MKKSKPSESAKFPELRACLFKVFEEVRQDMESGQINLVPRFDPDTYSMYSPEIPTTQVEYVFNEVATLETRPSYRELEDIIRSDARLNNQINRLISLGNGGSYFGVSHLIKLIVPRVFARTNQQPRGLELSQTFDECYSALESYLASDTVQVTVVWPLVGVSSPVEKLSRSEFESIRKLTVCEFDQVLRSVNFAYSQPVADVPGIEFARFALVKEFYVEKIYDEANADSRAFQQMLQNTADEFYAAWAISGLRMVRLEGYISHAYPHGFTGVTTHMGIESLRRWTLPLSTLGSAELELFAMIWPILGQKGREVLRLAAIRVYLSDFRSQSSDKLLDLMISAETLYLSGSGSYELKYRMSLRAAIWADNIDSEWPKSYVQKLMKKAYDVRSEVVHGEQPTNTRYPVGTQIDSRGTCNPIAGSHCNGNS